jgi:two-component system invasion response regulator UvrY
MQTDTIRVALADDHVLLRNALVTLINGFEGCHILFEAGNGDEVLNHLRNGIDPDVLLLDLSMPGTDGYETAMKMQQEFPAVHVLMLTMYDSELMLIRLLQAGVKGFLKKDVHPAELRFALQSVMEAGYYYSSSTAGRLANLFRAGKRELNRVQQSILSEQEVVFLQFACTDMTYKQIAGEMGLTPRTVDVIRDALFTKLDVRSRVGMAMVALRNGVVTH